MVGRHGGMKILFVSNYYPPSNYGWGYMQLCEEVVDGLAQRGHETVVLTSNEWQGQDIPRPYPVHRLLPLDPDWNSSRSAAWQFFFERRRRERESLALLRRMVDEYRPEVVFFWHYIGLTRALMIEAEQLPGVAVAYYLAGYHPELPDEYMAYWQARPVSTAAKLLKSVLAAPALAILRREGKPLIPRYENVACVSQYVRDRLVSQELVSPNAVVIHNGVDLSVFAPQENGRLFADPHIRILIAGQLKADKGMHTVVEAMVRLQATDRQGRLHLTILGDGFPDYVTLLKQMIVDNHLQDVVTMQAPVARDQMPEVLAQHDILVLASEYAEPLARAMQEAMAMGLLVIGTITGGSGELLIHEKTGLVFEPGNPDSLAEQLGRVLVDPARARELAAAGCQVACDQHDIRKTVQRVEAFLTDIVGRD